MAIGASGLIAGILIAVPVLWLLARTVLTIRHDDAGRIPCHVMYDTRHPLP
jgi:hypothetical protein